MEKETSLQDTFKEIKDYRKKNSETTFSQLSEHSTVQLIKRDRRTKLK